MAEAKKAKPVEVKELSPTEQREKLKSELQRRIENEKKKIIKSEETIKKSEEQLAELKKEDDKVSELLSFVTNKIYELGSEKIKDRAEFLELVSQIAEEEKLKLDEPAEKLSKENSNDNEIPSQNQSNDFEKAENVTEDFENPSEKENENFDDDENDDKNYFEKT